MSTKSPQLRIPLRGELLVKLTQRYPSVDTEVIDIFNTLKSVSSDINDRLIKRLEVYGLTEGKFYVLAYLHAEELLGHANPRPSDIADNLGVTRATVTGLLDGLDRADLITRNSGGRDRRTLTISMSEKARWFMEEILLSLDNFLRPFVADALSPDEQASFRACLMKVEAHLRDVIQR
jgi:DNA-binding MarR family transcriptional regulator